jgi:hypothetical protein
MSWTCSRRRYLVPLAATVGTVVICVLITWFLVPQPPGGTLPPGAGAQDTPPQYWLVLPAPHPFPDSRLIDGTPPAASPKAP